MQCDESKGASVVHPACTKYPHFTFLTPVRDVGVTLDQELTITQHLDLLCRSCKAYFQLLQFKVIFITYFMFVHATMLEQTPLVQAFPVLVEYRPRRQDCS